MSESSRPYVVITGASGGIGRTLCEAFSVAGYRVLATDIRSDPGLACEQFIECDLVGFCRSQEIRNQFAETISTTCKGVGLHCLVNNAAVQILSPTGELNAEDVVETFHVNVVAPLLLTQALLTLLEEARGSVTNVGSVHEWATKPGFVSYATSKAAIGGLTRALAVDLGGRVRVNSLAPGAVDTDMLRAGFAEQKDALAQLSDCHPRGRIAEPQEVAAVAVFLASDQASAITGSSIRVDGGVLSRLHDPL